MGPFGRLAKSPVSSANRRASSDREGPGLGGGHGKIARCGPTIRFDRGRLKGKRTTNGSEEEGGSEREGVFVSEDDSSEDERRGHPRNQRGDGPASEAGR